MRATVEEVRTPSRPSKGQAVIAKGRVYETEFGERLVAVLPRDYEGLVLRVYSRRKTVDGVALGVSHRFLLGTPDKRRIGWMKEDQLEVM